jgi:hypothetical protein
MTGYAHLGEAWSVFNSFERMLGVGIKPDRVTFVVLLNACSRVGLSASSQMYFQAMSGLYGIPPSLEHYACVLDLLGRAGYMGEAIKSMKILPMYPNVVLWDALLNACRNAGCVEIGKQAFEHCLHIMNAHGETSGGRRERVSC